MNSKLMLASVLAFSLSMTPIKAGECTLCTKKTRGIIKVALGLWLLPAIKQSIKYPADFQSIKENSTTSFPAVAAAGWLIVEGGKEIYSAYSQEASEAESSATL